MYIRSLLHMIQFEVMKEKLDLFPHKGTEIKNRMYVIIRNISPA